MGKHSDKKTVGMLEQEAVRKLLTAAGAGAKAKEITTFGGLCGLGFPYCLAAVEFSRRELVDLDKEMLRRPTTSALLLAFETECAKRPEMSEYGSGLVFSWYGMGGLHVCTRDTTLPQTPGRTGRFWRVNNDYYLLEPLRCLSERLGPMEDW